MDKFIQIVEEEFEMAQKRVEEEFELAKKRVEEELKLAKKRASSRIRRIFEDGNQISAGTKMKLKFRNRISQKILTGEEIRGEDNTPIEVALVDDPSGNTIDVGPEASASVEIVLLKGESDASQEDDWTVEEFNANIIPEMEGKKPILAGNIHLKLQGGIGVLENIRFAHHSSKIKPPVFKLGARVINASDGVPIKEAKTESFTVRDFRNKYYKKHETPSLSDEVSRLVNIRKGGIIDKRLQDNEINTVEDFLIRLLIDPQELKIIVNLGTKKWEATVNNARACSSDKRMYFFINLEQKTGVVFNVSGQVLGLFLKGHYFPTSMLSEKQKADAQELLASAYKHWEDVKHFDDVNSLQQHITGLSTYMGPLDSLMPDYPARGYENTRISEIRGKARSRSSGASFHSVSLIRQTDGKDLGSFSTSEVGIMYNAVVQCSSASAFNLERLYDEYLCALQFDSCNLPFKGLMDETNWFETQVVHSSNSRRRWKILLGVSIWISIWKGVRVAHNRKKQKVG